MFRHYKVSRVGREQNETVQNAEYSDMGVKIRVKHFARRRVNVPLILLMSCVCPGIT